MEGQGRYYRFAFKAMSDITGTIFVPVVVALFVSRWLSDVWTIPMFVVTFLFTAIVIVKKVRVYGKEYQKLVGGDGAAGG